MDILSTNVFTETGQGPTCRIERVLIKVVMNYKKRLKVKGKFGTKLTLKRD